MDKNVIGRQARIITSVACGKCLMVGRQEWPQRGMGGVKIDVERRKKQLNQEIKIRRFIKLQSGIYYFFFFYLFYLLVPIIMIAITIIVNSN